MANRTWKGGNTAVAQVWKGTITTTTAGHVYTVTLTDSNVDTSAIAYTLTGSEGSATAVALAFITAWNASVDPRIAAITASQNAGQVILTADTAGVPFSAAATTTSGTWSGTGNTTANAGPNDWNDAANWYQAAVPVASDNVIIQGSTAIKYGLDQSGVALTAVNFQNYTGVAGLPGAPLKLNLTTLNFSSSGLAYLNLGSSTVSPRITQTASAGTDAYGLYLLGSGIVTLLVEGTASVGVAVNKGETSTITTAQCAGSAKLTIGPGVTLTTYHQTNGSGSVQCAATTIQADAGTLATIGSGAVTTFLNYGATCYPNSSGTITTFKNYGGVSDFTQSDVARTVTTPTIYGGSIKVDPAIVTFTNALAIGNRLTISSAA